LDVSGFFLKTRASKRVSIFVLKCNDVTNDYTRKIFCFLILFFYFFDNCLSAQGTVIHKLVSNRFTVDIYLPAGYNLHNTYKTIYFNDGEQLFESRLGMRLDLLLDSLISKKITEPVIAVAINSKGNRLSLYTPYTDDWINQNWGNYVPGSVEYTQGIKNELVPFMEKEYAVDKRSTGRAMAGFSLGGLHATWAGIKYPELFGFSIAMSPSYWVANQALFKEPITKTTGNRFWFDMGTGEWDYYVSFYKQLQEAGYQAGLDCFYYEVKNELHNIDAWARRIQFPLIAFAGTDTSLAPLKMEVLAECIPSVQKMGTTYRRLNAIVTLKNGIRYSLSNTADYKLIKGDIELYDDGTIIAGDEKKAEIAVTYRDFYQLVKIRLANCELIK
jgi:enterochelin esterase-like enzyme